MQIKSKDYRVKGENLRLFFCFILLFFVTYFFASISLIWGFTLLTSFIIYVRLEQAKYMGSAIRIHEDQFPEVYEKFKELAIKLGIAKANLYIIQDPALNAHTIGISTCSVVLTSGIVESLNLKQLVFVLAHELGHFHAGHTRVSSIFYPINSGNLISTVIFGFWQRYTEYSADRCALLATKDFDAALETMMCLAVGKELSKKMSFAGYLKQLKYAKGFVLSISELFMSHPFISNRIKGLVKFWKEIKYEV